MRKSLLLIPAIAFTGIAYAHSASAQRLITPGLKTKIESDDGLGVADSNPIEVIATLVGVLLSLLGIVAIVLIIRAGLMWMTAQGNSDTIESAKKQLQWAAIGLVVILSSYSIANFVLYNIESATGQTEITATD